MSQIEDKYIQKIADILHIPYPYILAIRDMGLLDSKSVRDVLIKRDYYSLLKTKKFTVNQIVEKLSLTHNVSKSLVRNAAKEQTRHACFCKECGVKVVRSQFINNNGLCNKCFSSNIKT